MADVLLGQVRQLLDRAIQGADDAGKREVLEGAARRLDEPLRVAIAGKVKAGKSTLLNALVGEEVAPTDAGECTQVVTWYRHGQSYRVDLHHRNGGAPEQRPFHRRRGAIEVDLGATPVEEIDHLEVWWPSPRLKVVTLIDTPGIASISTATSARTTAFLAADDRPPAADAVIYLLRHLHPSDVRLLEGFHDEDLAHGTPVNAIAVLSRADEVGSCRLAAMESATRVAARYQADDRLRRLCHIILPVAGLLGQAGAILKESEHVALATIATLPREELADLLLTAERFGHRPSPVVAPDVRQQLLDRLGLFGIRLSIELIRTQAVGTSTELATELVLRSGVDQLRTVLMSEFEGRSRVLKARSALASLQAVLRTDRSGDAARLATDAERIASGAHEFAEVRLLNDIRSGELPVTPEQRVEIERLAGGSGGEPATRLGLPADAGTDALRAAALDALARWGRVAEHPMSPFALRRAARVLVRSCEGIVADLARL